MKKVFKLSVICLILSILTASCGSSANFTKRRYTKGNYVSYNFKKQSVETEQDEEEENTSQIEINETPENTIIASNITINTNSELRSTDHTDVLNTENESNQESNGAEEQKEEKTKPSSIQKMKNNLNPIVKLKTTIADKKSKQAPQSDGDALSLLWIVIIVLLILWALGFISGSFGGLVHLLLVIALILLILWLLRVI